MRNCWRGQKTTTAGPRVGALEIRITSETFCGYTFSFPTIFRSRLYTDYIATIQQYALGDIDVVQENATDEKAKVMYNLHIRMQM